MLSIEPGRERDFEAMSIWLAASAAIDDAIESAEPPVMEAECVSKPLPPSLRRAYAEKNGPRLRLIPGRVQMAPGATDAA